MLATLLSTPVNAHDIDSVIEYWRSARECWRTFSSDPSSRYSASSIALRASMRAMNRVIARMSRIDANAFPTNTASTTMTSQSIWIGVKVGTV